MTANNNLQIYKNIITSSYKLSLMEKRLIIAIVYKYKKEPQIPIDCEITVAEFSDTFQNLKVNYAYIIKETIEHLYTRTIMIRQNGKVHILRWVQLIKCDENENVIRLRWSEEILPYLDELTLKFEPFPLPIILQFKKKTSYRLLEIILLNKESQGITISIDLIRTMLILGEKYENIYELKRFVIKPAVDELNDLLHLDIKLEQHKRGKRITYFTFKWSKISL